MRVLNVGIINIMNLGQKKLRSSMEQRTYYQAIQSTMKYITAKEVIWQSKRNIVIFI